MMLLRETWPNRALQRTAAGRRSCNRRVSWPLSLSLGRWAAMVAMRLMKPTLFRTAVSLAAVLIGVAACSSERGSIEELDAAVRGQTPSETWNKLPPKFKHLQCLEYKISLMRKLVSTVSRAAELLEYYPRWVEGLAECGHRYPIDEEKAEQLREAIATKMAQVMGEEVSSYLTLQRLYSSEPRDNWLGKWRSFAIVGIAGVSEVLPKNP